jgi:hypothetical protein
MNGLISKLTLAGLLATTPAIYADQNRVDLELEPCINGAVSSTGLFPSQEMEDQIFAYLQWQSASPFYLFKVAGNQRPVSQPED